LELPIQSSPAKSQAVVVSGVAVVLGKVEKLVVTAIVVLKIVATQKTKVMKTAVPEAARALLDLAVELDLMAGPDSALETLVVIE